MIRRRLYALLAASMLMSLPAVSFAGPHGDMDNPQVAEKYRQVRGKALRERAGLDEATAVRVEQILNGFDPQRRDLRKRMKAEMRTLDELVQSDVNDQRAYQAALDRLISVQNQMEALRQKEVEALRKALTPKDQAKVLLALKDMRHRAHEMMRQRHGGGGRDGHGGGGGPGGRGPMPPPDGDDGGEE